ncbi:MAG: endo alpha-1,4 polygalactosaminidase [Deltaproteobacteria bacterium]|nr:endo alpha-1,4 polygalactosaminidase [Deltaproteobacteria bacterium]
MIKHALVPVALALVGWIAGCSSDDSAPAPGAGGTPQDAAAESAGGSGPGGSGGQSGTGGAATGGAGGSATGGTAGSATGGTAGSGQGGAGGSATGGSAGQAGSAGAQSWWKPPVKATWQWQLDTPVDTNVDAEVFDIDMFDNDASVVQALHAKNRKVICYMSAGSWEDYRPDKNDFPAEVIGNEYPGWPGEKFLDIRQIAKLAPIMEARMDQCKSKGFDGLEPDNIDTYGADTGFPLTAADQLAYNKWLADAAHARGLSIGLKNDQDQAAELLSYFDWALTEDCFDQGWCGDMSGFVAAGKPVFMCEYDDTGIVFADACSQAASLQLNAILKHRDLDVWRQTCP